MGKHKAIKVVRYISISLRCNFCFPLFKCLELGISFFGGVGEERGGCPYYRISI